MRSGADAPASPKPEVPRTSGQNPTGKSRHRRSYTKGEIEGYIRDYNMTALLEIAASDSRVIRDLQRMLYSVDSLLRRKAAEAMGSTAAAIAEREPGMVISLLQGLITSLTDTAASSWGSVAAIGEIIGSSPKRFGGYLPHLLRLSGDRILLRDVLAALGTISASDPELLRKYTYHFIPLLSDPSHEIRGLTVILLANLGAGEAKEDLQALLADDSTLEIYRKGSMETVTVRLLAQEALERL
jgi:HEAT repeat protein